MDLKKGNNVPAGHYGMPYMDFMGHISRARNSRRYLEVGVSHGYLMSQIYTDRAIGVDPYYQIIANVAKNKKIVTLIQEPSDTFFAEFNFNEICGAGPDLVFLDGMHTFEYLLRDFYNTEKISTDRTLIVMHDCLPLNAEMAERNMGKSIELGASTPFSGYWTGDVWKIIPILRKHRRDLRITYVDCPPTGLVCISNLNPSSTTLVENYYSIVDEFRALPNDMNSITKMYSEIEIIPSSVITNDFDLTIYFKG